MIGLFPNSKADEDKEPWNAEGQSVERFKIIPVNEKRVRFFPGMGHEEIANRTTDQVTISQRHPKWIPKQLEFYYCARARSCVAWATCLVIDWSAVR
jgi:hypothetical protein